MKTCGIFSLLLVGWGLSNLTLLAQTAAPAPADAKRIEMLVKQLASSRNVERKDAQKELEAIGEPALEALRTAVKGGDPEISRRAADLLGRMEEKATTANLLAPKMVKLSLKEVSVKDALGELKKQSGYDINLQVDPTILANRKISLETGEVTFFEALDKLCARAGLAEKSPFTSVPPSTISPPRLGPGPVKPLPIRPRPILRPVQPIQPLPQGGLQIQPLPGAAPALPVPQQGAGVPGGIDDMQQLIKAFGKPIQGQAAAQPDVVPADVMAAKKAMEAQLQALDDQVKALNARMAQAANGQALPPGVPGINGNGQPVLPGLQPGGFGQPVAPVGFRPYPQSGPQPLTLVDGKHQNLPTCYAGPVRVRLLNPDSDGFPKNILNVEGEKLLVFEIAAEPRPSSFNIQNAPRITKAIDDQGQVLTALETPADNLPLIARPNNLPLIARPNIRLPIGVSTPQGTTVYARTFFVPLKLGEKKAKTLKELTGTLTVEAQLPPTVVATIDNVLKAQNQSVKAKDSDALVTLVNIVKMGDGSYSVVYTIEGDNLLGGMGNINVAGGGVIIINGQIQVQGGVGGLPGMAPTNANLGTPQLVDANGKAYRPSPSLSTSFSNINGVMKRTMSVLYQADAGQGEPARLEFVATRQTGLNVPFSFKDVPLP